MLRQRTKRPKARAERQDYIRLRDELHRRLGALIAERAHREGMRCRKRIVVQVTIANGRSQQFRERDRLGGAARHDHAAAGEDYGKLRGGERCGGSIERRGITRPVGNPHRRRDRRFDLPIEKIPRNVQLGRTHLKHGTVKAARSDFRHALGIVHVSLIFGDLRENRQLLGLLKPAEPHGHRTRLWRDKHHRRMRPIGRGHPGNEIRDARSVLRNANAMTA